MATGFGAVGLGATVAGGLLSAFGAQSNAASQQQMYNYRAQVARLNADMDRQNASWARDKGEKEAIQYGMKASQQFGAIRATQGASGIDVNTGTAARVQGDQRKITSMDLDTIRANAGKVAYDYENRAVMDENQATLDVMAGNNAVKAGNISALGSIIGTVATVSSKWTQGNQIGLWGSKSSGFDPMGSGT